MMVQRVKDDLELCEMIFGCVTKTKHNELLLLCFPPLPRQCWLLLCMYVGMINFECQNTHCTSKVGTFL